MNRKLKTTITISAVIAGSILMVNAQEAKADDVNKTSSPQEAGLITKTKEGTVKKADVDKAKEEYETSKSKEGALEKAVQEKTEKAKTLEEKVKKLENTKKKTESITEDTICLLYTSPALEDEVALGVSYDNLDDYLEGKKVPEEIVKIIEGHYLKSEHKRNMPVTVFDFYNICLVYTSFGGSCGTTLALCYAIKHQERVVGLVLR